MSLDIGTLSGRIELDDRLTPVLDLSTVSVEQFEKAFGRAGSTIAAQATAFFSAEVAIRAVEGALKAAIGVFQDMSIEGAAIGDIRQSFERLTGQVKETSTTLAALREGSHGTVDDLELMKMVNQDLTAGMRLTDEQFRALATGGFAIAQAKGTDVKTVMDTLNDAMLTGRTRALQLMIGKIDLAAAEDRYARSLGTTADHLTVEGKLQASRMAQLEALAKATAKQGALTDGLDELVAQAIVTWKNFYHNLAEGIGTSQHVIDAFIAIRDALVEAFGGSSQNMLQTIVGWVNAIADKVAIYGPVVIGWFVQVRDWVMKVFDTVKASWNALPDWMQRAATASAIAAASLYVFDKAAGAVGMGVSDLIHLGGSLTTTFAGIPNAMKTLGLSLEPLKGLSALSFTSLGNAGISMRLLGTAAGTALGPIGLAAIAIGALYSAWVSWKDAQVDEQAFIATAMAEQKALERRVVAQKMLNDALVQKAELDRRAFIYAKNQEVLDATHSQILAKTAEEAKKLAAAQAEIASSGKTWHATVAALDADLVKTIQTYLAAGVSQTSLATVYKLTATQISAVAEALKEETKAYETQKKAIEAIAALQTELNNLKSSGRQSTTERIKAEADQWLANERAKFQKQGILTAEAMDVLDRLHKEKVRKGIENEVAQTAGSLIELQRRAKAAENDFDFARRHSDLYTAEQIANFKSISDALQRQVASWNSVGAAIDSTSQKTRTLDGEIITLEESLRRINDMRFGVESEAVDEYTVKNTPGGAAALLKELQWLETNRMKASDVRSFRDQEIFGAQQTRYNVLRAAYGMLMRMMEGNVPGFAEGGVGDFGDGTLALLHGKEAIVPIGGGMGGESFNAPIYNTFYVNGTGADVGRIASQHIMKQLKLSRQFWSA